MNDKKIDDNKDETENTTLEEPDVGFWDELWDLLLTDFKNSYLFITENKTYFIYGIVLIILAKLTSFTSVGKSIEKYCGKHIQKGGGGGEPSNSGGTKMLTASEINKLTKEDKPKKEQDSSDAYYEKIGRAHV